MHSALGILQRTSAKFVPAVSRLLLLTDPRLLRSIPVRFLKDAVPEVDDSEGVPAHEEIYAPPVRTLSLSNRLMTVH